MPSAPAPRFGCGRRPSCFPRWSFRRTKPGVSTAPRPKDEPEAELDDLEWADGFAFGTPTRFGNVATQLKLFIDQAGGLWEQGKLVNKVGTAFTASQTAHGGQESTILALNNALHHWGAIVLPLGYTVSEVYNGGGNPYGASFVTEGGIHGGTDEYSLSVARAQGRRLTQVAGAIALARRLGLLEARCSEGSADARLRRPTPAPRWRA